MAFEFILLDAINNFICLNVKDYSIRIKSDYLFSGLIYCFLGSKFNSLSLFKTTRNFNLKQGDIYLGVEISETFLSRHKFTNLLKSVL